MTRFDAPHGSTGPTNIAQVAARADARHAAVQVLLPPARALALDRLRLAGHRRVDS